MKNKGGLLGIIVIVVFVLAVVGGWFIYDSFTDKVEDIRDGSDSPLVGGCAGVSPDNLQECCGNWADENGVVHVACVGEWKIVNDECGWECDVDDLCEGLDEETCDLELNCSSVYVDEEFDSCSVVVE